MRFKEILCGIIIGTMITGGVFAVAEDTLSVNINPFKITVNGEPKNIEGYNINGSSYFKLRDIGDEVGFSVDFKEDTIMITTTEESVQTIEVVDERMKKYINYITFEEQEYIVCSDVDKVVTNFSRIWVFAYTVNNTWTNEKGSWCYISKIDPGSLRQLEEYKIPCVFIDGLPYLTRETFENEILARINAE